MPRKSAANSSSKSNQPPSKAVLLLVSELSNSYSNNSVSGCHLTDEMQPALVYSHREETLEVEPEVEGYLC